MSDNWWSNNWSNVAISVATALTFFVGWLQFVASKKAAAQLNRANVFFSIQVDGEKVVLSLRNDVALERIRGGCKVEEGKGRKKCSLNAGQCV